MSFVVRLLTIFLLLASPLAFSQESGSEDSRFVADIELQTSGEFLQLLQRADQMLVDGVITQGSLPRVTFLLHGPVLRDLLRPSYLENRELVDLAASLSALQVVEIKACQTWMADNGVNETDLQPYIETVPYAAGEFERLLAEKNYVRF